MFITSLALASPWTTEGFDAQRRHQSDVAGPASPGSPVVRTLDEELVVNMPLVEGPDGRVLVGTWGVIRDLGSSAAADWDKLDGELFAFDGADLAPAWITDLPRVPWCYSYDGADAGGCPAGETLNYYNGTVEGTPAVREGVAYVGRGDGTLYAIDLATGEVRWSFQTYNPEDLDDPEGGGEIIGGILADAEGTLYFATVGIGPAETNAVYAVGADGTEQWRYPTETAGVENVFWGALALSPDGETVYAPGAWGPGGRAETRSTTRCTGGSTPSTGAGRSVGPTRRRTPTRGGSRGCDPSSSPWAETGRSTWGPRSGPPG